jgi:SPOR domain
MAQSNHLSHRDSTAARSVPTPPRDHPLAELARLIGQSVTTSDLAGNTRRSTPAGSQLRRKFNPPAQHSYATPHVLLETSEEQYSVSEQGSCDPPNNTYEDRRHEPLPRAQASPQSRSAWDEREPPSHPDAADLHVESPGASYDEYEDQSHNPQDDHAYGGDYDKDRNPRLRGRFVFVAAVFGLALLGTGGAFVYRALLADSIVPPSIIKAESGPTGTDSQATVPSQSDPDKAGSRGDERPKDVPPPISTAPQPVSTEPAPVPGPSAASVSPPTPLAQPAPVAGVDRLNSPASTPAPPIPSANQAAAPGAPTPTPASPTKPGSQKIHTVAIRAGQPNAADSAASQPLSVAVRPPPHQQRLTKPSDANAPLSIVPSSNDAATAAAGSVHTAPAAHPARVGKPAATETASTAPVGSGGGYAVQVLSQHNKEGLQSSFHALQAKYPKLLGGREPTVRRADLGAKGVYYRAMVGPFVSAEQANELCSNLKAAGASCVVQKD